MRRGVSPIPVKRRVRVENFICHNGDFEFFQIGGEWYDTTAVQRWLERATGVNMPSVVDSAAIAGVVDLLRTQAGIGERGGGSRGCRVASSVQFRNRPSFTR